MYVQTDLGLSCLHIQQRTTSVKIKEKHKHYNTSTSVKDKEKHKHYNMQNMIRIKCRLENSGLPRAMIK